MQKYLVKYIVERASSTVQTRFFTTNDIEQEWRSLNLISMEDLTLVDIVPLGEVISPGGITGPR